MLMELQLFRIKIAKKIILQLVFLSLTDENRKRKNAIRRSLFFQ
jgi:hypothetical protein